HVVVSSTRTITIINVLEELLVTMIIRFG
ncbi:hypothetical protein AB1N83_012242, partial [Pleurotus pulmonarius]